MLTRQFGGNSDLHGLAPGPEFITIPDTLNRLRAAQGVPLLSLGRIGGSPLQAALCLSFVPFILFLFGLLESQ